MIRYRIILTFSLLFLFLPLFSQTNSFNIVFYNLENLFDTINNQGKKDIEFTPGGEKKWNGEKYSKKINDISRILTSVIPGNFPDITGLAGVENRHVLEDLIMTKELAKSNYGIVHENSSDPKGIEVALLYKKNQFKNISHKRIEVVFPFDSTLKTRDILLVSGTIPDGKVIHIFVNHWPQRKGAGRETESERMHCAVALRRNIDLLLTKDADSRIIVMGDFNDEPTNQSIMNIMQATNKRKNITPGDLYNLYYDFHNLHNEGTYYYRNSWITTDQIIISHNLLNRKAYFSCNYDSGKVYREDWMLFQDNNKKYIPRPTYEGNTYHGGCSDHLPVYITLSVK